MSKLNTLFRFKFLAIIAFALGLTACEPPPYNNLNNEQLQVMLDQGTPIVDVRRKDEWRKTGVIKNSKLLTFVDGGGRLKPGFLETFTKRYKKDDPVIVICDTGGRTDALARHLVEQMGYSQVYNVRNGISGWLRDDLKVTRARL